MSKDPTMIRWNAFFPAELLEEIDAWYKPKGISNRAEAMRQLLRAALDAEAKPALPARIQEAMAKLRVKDPDQAIDHALEFLLDNLDMKDLAPPAPAPVEPGPLGRLGRRVAAGIGKVGQIK